jgi:RNA polymerase sigma-70 factor (ECF subfamily)
MEFLVSSIVLPCTIAATFAPKGGLPLQFEAFDRAYVERLRSGDFPTQEHFVAYFSQLIHLKLRSRLRSPQDIEDVRQETFVRVFAALRKEQGIREPERIGAFVNAVCANVLRERYRVPSGEPLEDGHSEIPDKRVPMIDILAFKETQEKVREILEELPERDRRIIREIFLEERHKDDVCRDYGVNRDYLRVLLHRAKRAFKSHYLSKISEGMAVTRRQAE